LITNGNFEDTDLPFDVINLFSTVFKGASEEESGEREGSVALVVVSGIVITF